MIPLNIYCDQQEAAEEGEEITSPSGQEQGQES